MTDFLIRLEESAQKHGRSLSDEAKCLIRIELSKVAPRSVPVTTRAIEGGNLGTRMRDLIRPEDRGDDLVFEYREHDPKPSEG
jgi:hypothetical protein